MKGFSGAHSSLQSETALRKEKFYPQGSNLASSLALF
jgi:hypothetical protein